MNSAVVQSLVAVVLGWRRYVLHCSHHSALQPFWVLWQLLQIFISMQGCRLCHFLPPPRGGYPYPPPCPQFPELLTPLLIFAAADRNQVYLPYRNTLNVFSSPFPEFGPGLSGQRELDFICKITLTNAEPLPLSCSLGSHSCLQKQDTHGSLTLLFAPSASNSVRRHSKGK